MRIILYYAFKFINYVVFFLNFFNSAMDYYEPEICKEVVKVMAGFEKNELYYIPCIVQELP